MFVQRDDPVKGLVHRRARQVIHRGVHNAEILLFAGLEIQHLGDTHASIADQRAPGFDHQFALPEAARVQLGQQLCQQGIGRRWIVAVVVDAQSATQVDVVELNPRYFDGCYQIQHPVHGVQVWGAIGDLGADVAVNAHNAQTRQLRRALVGRQCVLMGHTKFVALEPGRNIGMGFRIHVRIDPDADGCFAAKFQSNRVQDREFGFAFHIEAADTDLQGQAHFRAGFANPRKNDLAHVATGGDDAREFARRDDVKAAARLGKNLQHPQRGVGLHGVTNLGLATDETPLVGGQRRQHGRFGVNK